MMDLLYTNIPIFQYLIDLTINVIIKKKKKIIWSDYKCEKNKYSNFSRFILYLQIRALKKRIK